MNSRGLNRIIYPYSKISLLCSCLLVLILAGAAHSRESESHFAKYGETKVHYQMSGKGEGEYL